MKNIYSLLFLINFFFIMQLSATNISFVPDSTKIVVNSDTSYSNIKMETFYYPHKIIAAKNNTSTNALVTIDNIHVSRNPQKILIAKNNKFAFVTCFLGNSVDVIDIELQKKIKSLIIPSPYLTIFNNDSTKIFVASFVNGFADSLKLNDCGLSIFSQPQSVLTEIDIENQNISRSTILWGSAGARAILNAEEDGFIFVTSDDGLWKVNLKNFQTISFTPTNRSYNAAIDKKNKKIFFISIDYFYRIDYLSGQVDSIRYYKELSSFGNGNILIDTVYNRIFIASTINSETLVYDASTLQNIGSLKGVYYPYDILILPDRNSLFISGLMIIDSHNNGDAIREYNNSSLEIKKNSISGGQYMAYDKISKCIYSCKIGDFFASSAWWFLDITKYDVNTEIITVYNTTDLDYNCCDKRSIAITTDYKYVIATNSPANTVSILPLVHNIGDDIAEDQKINKFSLSQNYPNPFNPTTIINYSLPKDGVVLINIYDMLGREVKTLVNEYKSAGNYKVEFNANNLTSGVYYYRITTGNFTQVKKLMLLK